MHRNNNLDRAIQVVFGHNEKFFYLKTTLFRRGSCYEFKVANYEFVRSFEIQVAKASNGQKNGSAEESTSKHLKGSIDPTR